MTIRRSRTARIRLLALPCVGRFSMAAGHDGLYLAGYNGESGRYFVAWDALEAGHWAPVAGAKFTP